jgi:hypothetical protein
MAHTEAGDAGVRASACARQVDATAASWLGEGAPGDSTTSSFSPVACSRFTYAHVAAYTTCGAVSTPSVSSRWAWTEAPSTSSVRPEASELEPSEGRVTTDGRLCFARCSLMADAAPGIVLAKSAKGVDTWRAGAVREPRRSNDASKR